MRRQAGFFDVDDRLNRLSDLGDQLEAFRAAVDFEMFRPDLDAALAYSDGAQGGRPPFDPVMMFKVLVIQAANNLSDERAEFLINDRLSFMRFLGLGLSDRIPDARLYRRPEARDNASDPARDAAKIGHRTGHRPCQSRTPLEGRRFLADLKVDEGSQTSAHATRRTETAMRLVIQPSAKPNENGFPALPPACGVGIDPRTATETDVLHSRS